MKNKLAVLDKKLPIRAYSEEMLNKVILMDLLPFLTKLLSLTDEVSADRLEIALPAIKTSCIGMGFNEIKKMFEMYVDSKLSLKPIPNYFDRILLGKIVSEYKVLTAKKNKPIMEEKEISEKEKEFIMIEAVDRIEKEVLQTGDIITPCSHIYDYIHKQGKLPKHTKEFKSKYLKNAKLKLKGVEATRASADYEIHKKLKTILEKIDNNNHDGLIPMVKKLVLIDYFKKDGNK